MQYTELATNTVNSSSHIQRWFSELGSSHVGDGVDAFVTASPTGVNHYLLYDTIVQSVKVWCSL